MDSRKKKIKDYHDDYWDRIIEGWEYIEEIKGRTRSKILRLWKDSL